MDKIIRINMTDLTSRVEDVPAAWAGLGGRGLTSTIVAAEVPPTCHALGPYNKLVFAPGLLTGTPAANSGRLSAGAKSPLTGTIKESNAGGTAAQMLARMGIKALIIEGQPSGDAWYHIHLTMDGVTIQEEKELVGQGNFAVIDAMEARLGKKTGVLTIGPAGEMKMLAANISVKDPDSKIRSHGRGGLGAVMGSKRVKCITIDDAGAPKVEIADPDNRIVTVWLDRTTHLPAKQFYYRRDAKTRERNEEVTIFGKYADAGSGVIWPHYLRRDRNGEKIFEIFASSVRVNNGLTDELFTLSGATKIIDKSKKRK